MIPVFLWCGRAHDQRAPAYAFDATTRSLGLAGLEKPVAFDVDAAGRIAVLDARESTIDVIEPDGKRHSYVKLQGEQLAIRDRQIAQARGQIRIARRARL